MERGEGRRAPIRVVIEIMHFCYRGESLLFSTDRVFNPVFRTHFLMGSPEILFCLRTVLELSYISGRVVIFVCRLFLVRRPRLFCPPPSARTAPFFFLIYPRDLCVFRRQATGELSRIRELKAACPEGFLFYSGDDATGVSALVK